MLNNQNYSITAEDLEKAASVRLFEKAAAAEGINLSELSDSQVENLYSNYQQSSEENTMNDQIIDLFEKQAAYEGIDLDALSDDELAYVYNNFITNLEDEMEEDDGEYYDEEEEAYEKLAEAEILGRHMARAYMDELDDYGYGYGFEKEAADQNLYRSAKAAIIKELGLSGKELEAAKKDGSLKKLTQEKYQSMLSNKKSKAKAEAAKQEARKQERRAGGKARFEASEKGQEIMEDRQIRDIEKKRAKRRKAEEAQKRLVAEQDMTKEQRAARKAKASRDEATAKLRAGAKRVGGKVDSFAQTVGQALGGKKDVYSGAARTPGGKRIKGSGKLMKSNALSRRLRGYGALGAGAALAGGAAYGASQMGKEASFDLFEEEAIDRANQFIDFGKEAGLDSSAIDMRALELLVDAGYDIEPIVYGEDDDLWY